MTRPRRALWSIAQSRATILSSKQLGPQWPPRLAQCRSPSQPTPVKRRRGGPLMLLLALVAGTAYYMSLPDRRPTTLNRQFFVPYSITDRETISPTSVLLTLVPREPDADPPFLKPGSTLWRYPLWSVELKQPELQIARHYTPLPPSATEPRAATSTQAAQQLRFYVRSVPGGEMSAYVSRLLPGRSVFVRGPHPSFDLLARLPQQRAPRLVFLAGGTGLVPGMQAACAVLDARPDASACILWAVRHRSEVQMRPAPTPRASLLSRMHSWLWRSLANSSASPMDMLPDMPDPSPISRELLRLKVRYGSRLDIRLAIDEQGSSFGLADIRTAMLAAIRPPSSVPPAATCCPLHDQHMHQSTSDLARYQPIEPCRCDSDSGKDLFIVSGPEGFVARYAGPKIWRDGILTQGAVGGAAADLQRRHPSLANDWLVLKL